ncbi:cyclopropane fatty acid synthase, partial [Streptococcus pneumoniae]
DYGPRDGTDLLTWIRGVLGSAGLPADGEVWLQTFPRIAGWMFNPVSFWYCHDAAGTLRAVLAEVNNTFGQHHQYLLCAQGGG